MSDKKYQLNHEESYSRNPYDPRRSILRNPHISPPIGTHDTNHSGYLNPYYYENTRQYSESRSRSNMYSSRNYSYNHGGGNPHYLQQGGYGYNSSMYGYGCRSDQVNYYEQNYRYPYYDHNYYSTLNNHSSDRLRYPPYTYHQSHPTTNYEINHYPSYQFPVNDYRTSYLPHYNNNSLYPPNHAYGTCPPPYPEYYPRYAHDQTRISSTKDTNLQSKTQNKPSTFELKNISKPNNPEVDKITNNNITVSSSEKVVVESVNTINTKKIENEIHESLNTIETNGKLSIQNENEQNIMEKFISISEQLDEIKSNIPKFDPQYHTMYYSLYKRFSGDLDKYCDVNIFDNMECSKVLESTLKNINLPDITEYFIHINTLSRESEEIIKYAQSIISNIYALYMREWEKL